MNNLFLLEDNTSFGYILSEYLKMKGFNVTWAKDIKTAKSISFELDPNLFILDINLPDGNGFEFAEHLKDKHPGSKFIFLTARDLKVDHLKGFHLGAVDYIVKPIDEEILLAKINAILDLRSQDSNDILTFSNLKLDTNKQSLSISHHTISLSRRECDILKMLLETPGQLVARKIILSRLWNSTDEFSRKSMDVFISRLRKYLESRSPVQIKNVHGKGFILE